MSELQALSANSFSNPILILFIIGCTILFFYCIYRAIKASRPKKSSEDNYSNMEYKMKCNTCGHIWCFTNSDLGRGSAINAINGLSQLGSAATGNILHMAATTTLTNANKAPEVSFKQCPKCGSRNVGIYYGGYKTEETPASATNDRNNDEDIDNDENDDEKDTVVTDAAIIEEQLRRYKKLLDDDIITQEEFDAKKKQLLGL